MVEGLLSIGLVLLRGLELVRAFVRDCSGAVVLALALRDCGTATNVVPLGAVGAHLFALASSEVHRALQVVGYAERFAITCHGNCCILFHVASGVHVHRLPLVDDGKRVWVGAVHSADCRSRRLYGHLVDAVRPLLLGGHHGAELVSARLVHRI